MDATSYVVSDLIIIEIFSVVMGLLMDSERIVSGSILNMSTGEDSPMMHYLFNAGSTLTSIAKVEKVIGSFEHPDGSMQLSIQCSALDHCGFVFALDLEFNPETTSIRDQILNEMLEESMWEVSGGYGVCLEDTGQSITLYDPEYQKIHASNIEHVEAALRINRPSAVSE